jgi:predicted alpha/beta-hydrolase family hydrolase
MQAWRRRLEALGSVTLFDYPYMAEKRRRPDPLPKLVQAHVEAIDRVLASEGGPLLLAGKSMGSRVGCHVAAAGDARVRALICFGYPLRGQNGKIRDEVLLALRTPVLFLQGTRDSLCPLDLLEATRAKMSAKNRLFVVEGGDHSLAVTKGALKKAGETQEEVDARIFAAVADFVTELLAEP